MVSFISVLDTDLHNMGLSENSVPLHPMVLLIILPMKNCYFIGNIPHFQTYPYDTPLRNHVGCRAVEKPGPAGPWPLALGLLLDDLDAEVPNTLAANAVMKRLREAGGFPLVASELPTSTWMLFR